MAVCAMLLLELWKGLWEVFPFPAPPFSGEAVLGQSAWQGTTLAAFTS